MEYGFTFLTTYQKKTSFIVAICSCFVYGYLAYFTTRSDFFELIFLVFCAFILTYILVEKSQFKFYQLVGLAILYRLLFILSIPNLSQDFFRFFWDGQLVLNGINPYLENVNFYFTNAVENNIHQAKILRDGMGNLNASHYSNYPPISQCIYAISAWFAKESILLFIIALRLILISFDIIFILFARKILLFFNKNPNQVFWYALCPLSILEISGNLHLEGVMISLFIVSFYYLIKHKYILSALLLSLSISTKLLSLIFIPVLIFYLLKINKKPKNYKITLTYIFWLSLFLIIQFSFFYNSTFINNFSETIGLWFGKFEFNASIFYVVRWIGYQLIGWNVIQTYSLVMPVIAIVCFGFIIYLSKSNLFNLLETFMWMLILYFLLSTTVHPWYILFPLALSVFTKYNAVFLWSLLVVLSYYAYTNENVKESTWLLIIEYSLFVIYMFYELRMKSKKTD